MKKITYIFLTILLLFVLTSCGSASLVATYEVEKTVNNAKKESAKRTVEGYAKALESEYYLQLVLEEDDIDIDINNLEPDYTGANVSCKEKIIADDEKIQLKHCKVEGFDGTFDYKDGKALEI